MADEIVSWNSLTDKIYDLVEADIDVGIPRGEMENIMDFFSVKIGGADIHRIVIDYDNKEISIWPVLQSTRTYYEQDM